MSEQLSATERAIKTIRDKHRDCNTSCIYRIVLAELDVERTERDAIEHELRTTVDKLAEARRYAEEADVVVAMLFLNLEKGLHMGHFRQWLGVKDQYAAERDVFEKHRAAGVAAVRAKQTTTEGEREP